jgi:hypothetical protein
MTKKIDGYKLLKENPTLRAAVERMARVKIVFEEIDTPIEPDTTDQNRKSR